MQLSLQTEKLGSNSISLEQFKWFSYRSLLLYLQLHLVLILKNASCISVQYLSLSLPRFKVYMFILFLLHRFLLKKKKTLIL